MPEHDNDPKDGPTADETPTGAIGPHSPHTDPRLVTGEVVFGDDATQSDYDTLTEADDKEEQRRPGHNG